MTYNALIAEKQAREIAQLGQTVDVSLAPANLFGIAAVLQLALVYEGLSHHHRACVMEFLETARGVFAPCPTVRKALLPTRRSQTKPRRGARR